MPINLMYHDVTTENAEDTSGFGGPGAARYKLPVDQFERHLDAIAAVVREIPLATPSKNELKSAASSLWTITFDDGGVSAATEIAERLERRGWRGWFFITTDFLDTAAFCSQLQIKELHRRGHLIGSHSCSHPERISDCSWDQLVQEWTRSRQILTEIIEQPVVSASVPGGFYSTRVAQAAAKSGIQVLFNSEPTTGAFEIDGMLVLGRYSVYRGMSADDVASLMTSPMRRMRQAAFWNLKKAAKVLVGPAYQAIRQHVLSRKYAAAQH